MSWMVRRAALEFASTEVLIAALQDANRFVRVESVQRLIPRLDEENVEAALLEKLSDRLYRVSQAVYPAIPKFGPDALPLLERLAATESVGTLAEVAPFLPQLAEARPHPRQKNLADALKKRAKEWFLPGASRKRLREAAERIEWAIFHLKDLPIAVETPTPGPVKNLPIPWWRR